jgi:hypothetical protein
MMCVERGSALLRLCAHAATCTLEQTYEACILSRTVGIPTNKRTLQEDT